MSKTTTIVGPADHGRRMALDEFEFAEAVEGYLYELSRGVVAVIEVPRPRHLVQIDEIRNQFSVYRVAHPGRIFCVAGGTDCKILLADLNSERHPDLAIYKTPPPIGDREEEDFWATWIPEVVIEVVSSGSRHRDYEEKPEEYLRFGVREYWIVDADQEQMTVLRRWKGKWSQRVIRPGQIYKTRLLPGLEFDCAAVFEAAARAK